MPSLLESIAGLLDEHRAAAVLAPLVGGDDEQVGRAIRPSLGRIIDGLAIMADRGVGRPDLSDRSGVGSSSEGDDVGDDRGCSDGGGDLLTVADLVERHDQPGPENVADYLHHASPRAGDEVLDRVFGAERGLVVVGLASGLELTPSLIGRLLPMLAPLVTADLAARWDGAELPALARMLLREQRTLEREGLLDGLVFDLDRLVEVVSAEEQPASTTEPVTSAPAGGGRQAILESGTVVEHERSPSITIDETRDRTAEEDGCRASTLVVDPEPSVGEERSARVDRDEEKVDLGEPNGIAQAALADVVVDGRNGGDDLPEEIASELTVEEMPVESDQDDRAVGPVGEDDDNPAPVVPTLAWLGWAIGAVVLVLLLAWLLSSLGDEGDGSISTTAVAVEQSDPDSNPDSGPGSVPDRGSTPALDGAVEPATIEPDPAGPTGGGANDVPSGGLDVNPEELDADALLRSGIDAILRDIDAELPAEVSVVAVDGAVILAGEVESEAVRSEVEAAVVSLAGVTSIDNRIAVAPSITVEAPAGGPIEVPAADLVTGATLNELLDLDPVSFEAASSDLTSQGRLAVDEVAWFLSTQPGLELEIAGHTDNDGEPAANAELSQARADVVFNRLVAAGIEPGRLTAVGYGADRPKVPNDSLDNKAINRRIDFVVR